MTSIRIWLVLSLLAGGIGAAYSTAVGGTPIIGGSAGCAVGAMLVGFELFIVQGAMGRPLRRMPMAWFISITSLVWAVLIAVALISIPKLFGITAYGEDYAVSSFRQDFLFSFAVGLGFNAVLRTSSLVGHRVLINFLLGRYYRPRQENRVFLFLDLKDSTLMAEKLGDIRVQSFIARFFSDIAAPIARFGGETHRYIGDEIVVTWTLEDAVREARCIRCVLAIDEMTRRRTHWFIKHYGFAPNYRIGMHGGTVVVGEIGDNKREIVYFGATINTAARLCALCKKLDRSVLVSDRLLAMMQLPGHVKTESIGAIELAGIDEPVAVSEPYDRLLGRTGTANHVSARTTR